MPSVTACGLRLTGLAAQGSIPWACVGLGALFSLVLLRAAFWKIPLNCSKKEVKPMINKTSFFKMWWYSTLETIWGIGTSSVAGALPA